MKTKDTRAFKFLSEEKTRKRISKCFAVYKKKMEVASHRLDALYKKAVPQTKHPRKISSDEGDNHSLATTLKNLVLQVGG